jgi:hypothetical protein
VAYGEKVLSGGRKRLSRPMAQALDHESFHDKKAIVPAKRFD